jgi:hypothetical protein
VGILAMPLAENRHTVVEIPDIVWRPVEQLLLTAKTTGIRWQNTFSVIFAPNSSMKPAKRD